MHLEVSRVVKAQPERVYAVYTDFENMPKWSKRLTTVRVTQKEGGAIYLQSEGVSSKGARRKTEGELRLVPPSRVESESETRFTKSKRIVTFEAIQDGTETKVTATLDVEVKGFWSAILAPSAKKDTAEASAKEELDSFARFVEATPSASETG